MDETCRNAYDSFLNTVKTDLPAFIEQMNYSEIEKAADLIVEAQKTADVSIFPVSASPVTSPVTLLPCCLPPEIRLISFTEQKPFMAPAASLFPVMW